MKKNLGFTLIELLIVIAIIAILALIAIPNFLEAQTRAKVSRAQADMRTIATALEAYFVDHNAYPLARMSEEYEDRHAGYEFWMWFDLSIDGNPGAAAANEATRPRCLTSPVAYMSTHPPRDPFGFIYAPPSTWHWTNLSYTYINFLGAYRWLAADDDHDFSDGPAPKIDDPNYPLVAPAPFRFNGEDGPVYHTNWALMSPGPSRNDDYPAPDSSYTGTIKTRYFLYRQGHWRNMCRGGAQIYDPTNGTMSIGNIWRLSGASQPQ